MKKLLLTGGAGFIGSHFIEHLLKETDWEIVILDRLDISGNLERLRDISIWEQEKHRVKFVWWDLKAPFRSEPLIFAPYPAGWLVSLRRTVIGKNKY